MDNLTDKDKHKLRHARRAIQDLAEAQESLEEIKTRSVGSPNMDGMPRASSTGDPTGRAAQHIDYAERKLDKAQNELERARRVALRVCARIRNGHAQKFCEAYFVEGFPFSVAQQMSGVKERQCYGYLQAINA